MSEELTIGIAGWSTEPDASLLPSIQRRRLPRLAVEGVTVGLRCLARAGVTTPDAILTATAFSSLDFAQRSLLQLVDPGNTHVQPQLFIESTPNVVGSHLAIVTHCSGPNVSHTQGDAALTHMLLHAALLQRYEGCRRVLLVAAEEDCSAMHDVSRQLRTPPPTFGAAALLLTVAHDGEARARMRLQGELTRAPRRSLGKLFSHLPVEETLRLCQTLDEGATGLFESGGGAWQIY